MNYNEAIAAWQNLLETPSTETEFLTLIPRAIEATENRIYRELDPPFTIKSETGTLVSSSRNVTLPSDMLILRSANVVTPFTQTSPDSGSRNPLLRVSNEYLDMVYPSSTVTGVPQYYAMLTDTQCLVGPSPDQNYTIEFVGTYRPAVLSPTNPTNFLTLNMPDLYIAAGMVFWSAYYQNYGAASDNPQMAVSWEARYQTLFSGINVETMRQKAASVGWTSYQPTPLANTSRDK